MHPSVTAALPEIAALCERLGVSRLDLFGSATGPEFDEQTSDIDVVVEFGTSALSNYFDAYFALKEGLQQILGRPVDVVVAASVRNPYFLRQLRNILIHGYAIVDDALVWDAAVNKLPGLRAVLDDLVAG